MSNTSATNERRRELAPSEDRSGQMEAIQQQAEVRALDGSRGLAGAGREGRLDIAAVAR